MELKMTKKYKVDMADMSFHFIVIGCGGTGSFLIRDLARLIAIKNQDIITAHEKKLVDYQAGRIRRPNPPMLHGLTIADGDVIEEKNIRRQNFVMGDVGRNKAEVMQERYSVAYGLEIGCCDSYVSSPEHLQQIATSAMTGPYGNIIPVFIGCVDNNATRSLVAQTMDQLRSKGVRAFWLDGGNEEFSGQLVLGNNFSMALKDMDLYSRDLASRRSSIVNMPVVTQVYPEILDVTDKRPDQMSCDDRAVSFPQCIATNITMATLILDFCNHFINMPGELETWMINFDVKKINFGTIFNTVEDHSRVSDNPVWKAPTLQVSAK
jgi:molybdopterin/thiamine biosynthesis adenylyltransferase